MSNPYKCQNPIFLADETPLCAATNNNSGFRNKIHYLQFWLKQIDLAHEGFWLSHSYANSPISNEIRAEGVQQKKLYLHLCREAIDGLYEIERSMTAILDNDMEEK